MISRKKAKLESALKNSGLTKKEIKQMIDKLKNEETRDDNFDNYYDAVMYEISEYEEWIPSTMTCAGMNSIHFYIANSAKAEYCTTFACQLVYMCVTGVISQVSSII